MCEAEIHGQLGYVAGLRDTPQQTLPLTGIRVRLLLGMN